MKTRMVFASLVVALSSTSAFADSPADLAGTWEGFLRPSPAAEIRLILLVEKAGDGAWKAKVETPDFAKSPVIDFDEFSFKDVEAVLAWKKLEIEFRGKLDPDRRELVGEWKKSGKANPVTFVKVEAVPVPEVWEGSLDVGAVKLRLVFRIGKLKGDALWASMDSPDQGALGFRTDSVAVDKEMMKIEVKSIGGVYEGRFEPGGTEVSGKWKQGGASFPLTLKKVAKATEIRRSQEPKPPFPYRSVEVAYDSRASGVRISGTMTLPNGDGPFPAVLLITGSGPQDRDETLLGHKPFLVLADDLTRRGIGVLRVDDRGVRASTGNHAAATSADFAEDALGGVDFLRKRPEIDPKRVGLMGHSEGGLIAPMVASRSPDVAFIVLLAGPGLPGDVILKAQNALILRALGADEGTIKGQVEVLDRLIVIAKENEDPKVAKEKIRSALDEVVKALPEETKKALEETSPESSQAAQLATPWFRYFLGYDPRPTLAKVRCPILAINGENDLQVPSKDNLEAIDKAVRSGGNDRVTLKEMPSLNHLFQTSATGSPSDYGTIEETFAPAALKVIGDWIVDQVRVR